ncbi:MAG: 50S ribosomal protein L11 methyltransferase [Pyrinomonadaceae bacterium]
MNAKPEKWFAVSVSVPPEYVEAAEFAFNNLDSLGSEIDLLSQSNSELLTVTAYFSAPPDDKLIENELKNSARIHGLADDIDLALRQSFVEDQDWLAEWKKYWKPVEIGRFVIAAPWHEVEAGDKLVIRIEPNMAFGTGTHETTQLCLAAVDENYQAGMSFLDVGTGTGILAIAAAVMSETDAEISAVDIDADAVKIAQVNARMNGVAGRISFSSGSVEAVTGRFDIVCANLTADVIVRILPELAARTNSLMILSGILATQESFVLNALPDHFRATVTRSGEWIAITCRNGRSEERVRA